VTGQRAAELAANLLALRGRIAAAAQAAGRDAETITIIAVTKTWPAADVRILAGLGLTQVAENRHQEGAMKCREVADPHLTWHFIGGLQSNKVRQVLRWSDVVHGVDRSSLIPAIAAASPGHQILVQVSLDGDPRRGGCAPGEVLALAEAAHAAGLHVRGLMAVAPLAEDPAAAFGRLALVAASLRAELPGAHWISAGMSGDLEAAIAAGATHVRVGTVLLGHRSPLDG
jgi:pyridoxal phosphate enzyme (YggS family)